MGGYVENTGKAGGWRRVDVGLAVQRAVVGGIFVAHGLQKYLVIGVPGLIHGFTAMGIVLPGITAPMVAVMELVGGVGLVTGIFTRLSALGLAVTMAGAVIATRSGGFFAPGGVEFPLALLGALVGIACMGGGCYTVPRTWRRAGGL